MKRRHQVLLILFISITLAPAWGQVRYDFNWILADDKGNSGVILGNNGVQVDFNQRPPVVKNYDTRTGFYFADASFSDSLGKLMYYTNGCEVRGGDGYVIENGGPLNPPGYIQDHFCVGSSLDGTATGPQSLIFLPRPGSDTLVDMFYYIDSLVFQPTVRIFSLPLSRMTISTKSNKAISVNERLFEADTLFTSGLTAVKHSNNVDWWVIGRYNNNNKFWRIRLSSDAIDGPYFQDVGPIVIEGYSSTGQAKFSPNGEKYAMSSDSLGLVICDFDRSTGLLSNPLQMDSITNWSLYGLEFSGSGRFLCVADPLKLYQIDMEAVDVTASLDTVAYWDGFVFKDNFPTQFYFMERGADCKIYMITPSGNPYMHVIEDPEVKGVGCNMIQRGIELPTNNFKSIPHFPNYRLGTGHPACDPHLPVGVTNPLHFVPEIMVWPNPVSDILNIRLTVYEQRALRLVLVDVMGRTVLSGLLDGLETELDVSNLSDGLYFYKVFVEDDGYFVGAGRVVIQH